MKIDASRQAAFLSRDQPGFCRHENFERHSGGTTHLALRDGRDSLCVRVFCTRDHVRLGNFEGNADLGERSRSPGYYSSRRTFIA